MAKTKKENKEVGIHFKNGDLGGYHVTCVASNSETLNSSEHFEVKASCIVNIAALVKLLTDPNLMVIDETKERVSRKKLSEILK